MTALEIREIDPFDEEQLAAWHAVHAVSERLGREELASVWTLHELRVAMREESTRRWQAGYVGLVEGRVVVSAHLETPLRDNLTMATLWVDTHPDERRRGHASALLRHLESVASAHGRSVLVTEAPWPVEGPADGEGAGGVEFLRAHGFALALRDVMRVLPLPVSAERLAELAALAAPHHASYTLHSWVGPVPDEWVRGWSDLASTLVTEAPTGEIPWEPEANDVVVVRELEATIAKQGRTKFNTVALDAEGAVVAYTDIAATIHEPGKAYQWGTLVRRADRGHRLGLAVKVANLQLMQREAPELVQVVTWNADVNAHMVQVNEQLGFTPVEFSGEFQKRL